MLTLSQIIYGVQDLDRATRQIESRGFTVLDGGVHPGLGTANRIVPLGDTYFEILGIINRQEALHNAYGSALLRQTQDGDRLVRWSLRTDTIDEVAKERDLVPENRSRRRPDGTLLTWRAAGLALSLVEGWLPFFMQWDDPAFYPGNLPAHHPAQPQGVAWLEITPGDRAWLERWLGKDAQVPLRIVEGNPGVHRVGLNTPAGILVLP
ncbi:VOC family protein [Ktedonosporobacter rubrisoli]|uniref:VOC family protein n=1 Tax=Ktedonosporobacter rubrisoli TaxID=2509675 RepID=A0A4P6K383_KTERU|nr:VOC family protein [Ktedonosporobacter rubrisoli]QBD82604.1 VOC family protein [Ktedonosporobacter rubrisoli]